SLAADESTKIVRRERIKITTIDSFFDGQYSLTPEILLKLDVQGFELEALKGAAGSLPRIRVVQAELSLAPLYKDAPLFAEVVSYLENQGFEMFTIIPGFKDGKSGRLLQADGIFVRRER